jgi:type II secretory pathway predicted ATPase ExeA
MFLEHYHLREHPFGVTPDPRFLYLSAGHREALAALLCGIETGRGFLGLVAQPGMGKTTLVFQLLERLKHTATTVFLFQTQCDSRELLGYLLGSLGIETAGQDIVTLHEKLNEMLARELAAQRKFVLVIDEAQNLADAVLETVRLLSDFETPDAKLLQILLVGQPQLGEKLAGPPLVQLRQRMAILGQLQPFTPTETAAYIKHRLRVAGYEGGPLFTSGALEAIAAKSGGIPRNINTLCFNALALGYGLGRKQVDAAMIAEVVADLDVQAIAQNKRPAARPVPAPVLAGPEIAPIAPAPPNRPTIRVQTQPPAPSSQGADQETLRAAPSAAAARPSTLFAKPPQGAPKKERSYGGRFLGVVAIAAALVVLFVPYSSWSGKKHAANPAKFEPPAAMAAPSDPSSSSPHAENVSSPAEASPAENASAGTATAEPAAATTERFVVVAPKQTLRQICLLHLGRYDGNVVEAIRRLNPALTDPNHLEAGQKIVLPAQPSRTQKQ